jgi:hypothetical protein
MGPLRWVKRASRHSSRARNEFGIKHGDLLLVVKAPNTRGIELALLKADFERIYGKSN